jgi:hypothetical protein
MKQSVFLIFLVVAGSANAQQIMDGSGKSIDDKVKSAIFTAFTSAAADPFTAQIIELKVAKNRPELICGMVNLKNSFGAYTGFQPFGFNTQYNNLLVNQNLSDCL